MRGLNDSWERIGGWKEKEKEIEELLRWENKLM